MLVEPTQAEFGRAYDAGEPQVVWTRLVADLETPVSAMLKLSAGRSNCFLLESVEGGAVRGRYSIIGIEPDLIFRAFGERAEVNADPRNRRDAYETMAEPSLDALRRLIAESRIKLPEELPPMAAGIFGYLGYDMVRQMEDLGPANPDALGLPDAILIRPTTIVIFDSVKDELTIVTPVRAAAGVGAELAHARAVDRLTAVVDALDTPARQVGRRPRGRPRHAGHLEHAARALSRDGQRAPRNTSPPATSSRSCCRSVSRRRSPCRPSRSTARCAGSTRRPISTTSTSAASRSPARAPKSSSASVTAR